ncbi:Putative peroxiredoxin [Candidatus Bealeia paramacronuclearis]|uniref:Glutathione-dependent peroxiredoxin n=1 Tax=Candidatus Bealeia paramacronuclearis TaxID=1921001 RepID=A0ABZ2C5X0_9PROT|nr:putative peroxiredoxin [Candidatus Bealeia paramacronuclearis]
MMIEIGKEVPVVGLKIMTSEGIKDASFEGIFKGKKVALFAVPGAFTPTCSNIHLPSFSQEAQALKSKGVDAVYCVAVNDPFVLEAWKKSANIHDEIQMLSDGNCDFTRASGMELDGRGAGLGWRSNRYSLLAEDGIVKVLNIETAPGECKVSDGKTLLSQL